MKKQKLPVTGVGLREICRLIGVARSLFLRWTTREGFPVHFDGKGKYYIESEVREWIRANVKQNAKAEKPSPQPSPGVQKPDPLAAADDPLIAVLENAKSPGLELTRAAASLAARRVAKDAKNGLLSASVLGDLAKASQELRQAESAYMELAELNSDLIPRATVKEFVGTIIYRAIQMATALENSIGSEFAVWLADPAVRSMDTDLRAKKVRDFVALKFRELRELESQGIDKMLGEKQ